ncbi:hypothetical protein Syun_028337 [Stephania yunnanensis]|uniref:O-methyltransferase C-terminal domain-containing protein n=1 Tax=Stephania yunnanensis TaxID=152371 RepID=A0AAP0EH60_9MAGN
MVLEGGEVNEHSIAMDECEMDPNIGKIYNKSQYSLTTVVMEKMMEIYKGFEGLKSLIDVGGGVGTASSFISRKYPSIKVIIFDLPRVIEEAPVIPGVEHVGGYMFESNIPKAEAIFMKNITHNWSDEHCLKLLRNCYEVVPDDGKVIIMEFITPQVPEPKHSMRNFYQLDVIVMVVSGGGKERDEEDFNVLGKKAGFASVKTTCRAYGYWIIELRKSP